MRHFLEHGSEAADNVIDQGIVLFFPAPHSFTGEDVVEFHAHGGPVVLDLLLKTIVSHGARLARPGEFSERAFLNGKLDLAQAEAVADLINSASAESARNAMRSLQGRFSTLVKQALEQLIHIRMHVEASIDFPDDEIDLLADVQLRARVCSLRSALESVLNTARNGVLVRDGITIVLAGKPNAGKSSLMNQLCGRDVAIVTPIPGTTRDVLRENIQIDGLPLHVVDTAGLRVSANEIEHEGVRRALSEIHNADRLLLVVDSCSTESAEQLLAQYVLDLPSPLPPVTVVLNKSDLSGVTTGVTEKDGFTLVGLSALTGEGMQHLRDHLKASVGYHNVEAGDFSARRRHLDALERTLALIESGMHRLQQQGAAELFAEHLRLAQQALGEITGEFRSDELLGRIFAGFCIGK